MNFRELSRIAVLLFSLYGLGVQGIRIREMQVPDRIQVGAEWVRLSCNFELENEELYSVKWYKDDVEFFRFEPHGKPVYEVFDFVDMEIDRDRLSNGTVYLLKPPLSAQGVYRCEVSADAPSFHIASAEKFMTVVDNTEPSKAQIDEAAENSTPCEEGWMLFGQFCYRAEKEDLTWDKASEFCACLGGHLASIHSQEQQDFFTTHVLLEEKRNFWIGMRDKTQTVNYIWEDGSDVNYTDWSPGEPSQFYNSKVEDCVEMRYKPDKGVTGQWNDQRCVSKRNFICQKEAYLKEDFKEAPKEDKTIENPIPCEEGWLSFGKYCYRAEKEDLAWDRASVKCGCLGGNLASIHSQEQQDFLTVFVLMQEKRNFFIGLHAKKYEDVYAWEDGSDVNYTYWNPGQPAESTKEQENCVEMYYKDSRYKGIIGGWNDLKCTDKRPYICQKEKSEIWNSENPLQCSSEEGGGQKFRGACYNFVFENKTWEDAELYCQDHFKGHLVTISDSGVDRFLNFALRNFNGPFLIGIKLQDQLQQKWVSGWHVTHNFLPSDTSSQHREGFCIVRSRPNLWIEAPCHHDYPFICETSKDDPPKLKNSLKGWKCPEPSKNWRDLDGEFCYHFDTSSSVTWHEAHVECLRRGGRLASIHSQEESDILQSFVEDSQENIFIGLNSLLADGTTYSWSDGTQLNYTHWAPNQPNGGDEKCVQIHPYDMLWHDVPCDIKKGGFICSVKKVLPDETSNETQCNVPDATEISSDTVKQVCVVFKSNKPEAEHQNTWSTEIFVKEDNKEKKIIINN